MKTIEEKADLYGRMKVALYIKANGDWPKDELPIPGRLDLQQKRYDAYDLMQAFEDGATEALQSQWRRAEDAIIEQRQEWNSKVIYLIADQHGSVQLELYKEMQPFGSTVWLWDLYVLPEHRRRGHAKRLLRRAEAIAKAEGHKAVTLEWEAVNSEEWLLHYYLDNGYSEKQFSANGDYYLLEKNL